MVAIHGERSSCARGGCTALPWMASSRRWRDVVWSNPAVGAGLGSDSSQCAPRSISVHTVSTHSRRRHVAHAISSLAVLLGGCGNSSSEETATARNAAGRIEITYMAAYSSEDQRTATTATLEAFNASQREIT